MSGAWEIVPRDADLGRTLDPVTRWSSLDVVERYNIANTWVLSGPSSALRVFTPGMGCILDRDGDQVTSGQVRSIYRRMETDDDGRVHDLTTLGFISDLDELGSRRAFPQPSKVLTSTPSKFTAAHDVRNGPIETVLLAYIAQNLGPAAPVANRRQTKLVLPASLGRGGTTTASARMDDLARLVHDLGEAGRLRVDVQHDESTGTPRLLLTISEVPDVSADVRFGFGESPATGTIASWSYKLEAPELTRAIVFSAGELEARDAAQFVDAEAEALWGRAREGLVDQRQTDDVAEITRAGTEALAEGATPVTVEFTVADGPDIKARRDYDVGYKVGVELPDLPDEVSDNVVRELATEVRPNAREKVSLVVGTPGATSQSTKQAARLNRALRKIALLERST
ncbi:Gp37-like protein [Cellulosimicrobium funkei]|uniref:Gp37-like protein n=1 Tax=Cellulosimicrobium funkei TaxID=264251 RepID=UPI00369D012D